jgi:hypothetical protein
VTFYQRALKEYADQEWVQRYLDVLSEGFLADLKKAHQNVKELNFPDEEGGKQ